MDRLNWLIETLRGLDQDQAIVALFAGVLVLCVMTVAAATVLRALGKWGAVAAALAVIAISYRLAG